MAVGFMLPPPSALEIHNPRAAKKWKKFKMAWIHYSVATERSQKFEEVQVATILTVFNEEALEIFSTFTGWTTVGNEAKIGPVLQKFEQYY